MVPLTPKGNPTMAVRESGLAADPGRLAADGDWELLSPIFAAM